MNFLPVSARRVGISITLCCVLPLLGSGVRAFADPVYTLEHIGRSDGLPQSSVRAIAVDRSGFLWVGTETGVARYDGYRFKEVAPPFGNGVVMTLHVDSRNRLWVHWYGKPLTLYDPGSEQWQVLGGAGPDDYFGGIVEDPSGTVWLSSRSELRYYDEALRHTVVAAALSSDPAARFWQPIAFYRDRVWVGAHHEVVGFDVRKRSVVQHVPVSAPASLRLWVYRDALWLCNSAGVFRLQDDIAQWQAFYRPAKAQVTACEFDADGALWVGTSNEGAIRVLDGIEQHFRARETDFTTLADNTVVGVKLDSRGQLWVITPGNAHRSLGPNAGRFERFEYSPDSQPATGGVAASTFVEDQSGVLWLGSEDWGLAKISPFARKARHLLPPSTINSHVRTPVVDADGNVWMGMNQDGVFRWNPATATWTHFVAAANDPSQLPTREVRAMLAARDGTIWAGSSSGGIISQYHSATGTWKRVTIGKDNLIFTLLELPNGHFMVGRDSLVTEFNPATGQSRHFPSPGEAPIRASVLSHTGHVLFGTHQGGVLEFIPGRGFARSWVKELSDLNVFSIYEDRHGVLWIGTWGGGLNRLDPESGQVQVIGTRDGLPDGTIFGILPGRHDDLWVSTYAGLARIEHCIALEWPCRPGISVFDRGNGLPFSEFDSEAAARAPGGELLFGGLDGLMAFDPDKIEKNRRPPRLQFSAMFLNDKALAPPSVLELKHDFGSLKIEFSALDLNASANDRYRYRLSESGDWLSLGANASIVLNNLSSGRHVLEISGTNNDGVWSESSLTLPIRVLAPWYGGTLAGFAYLALLALGVAVLVKWRERRLRDNNVRLETTVAERTRELAAANIARDEFYANVSHEIRTPLTLLIGTAEALKSNLDQTQKNTLADDLVRHSDSLRRYVESLITVAHLQSSPTIAWLQEDVGLHLRGVIADFQRVAGATTIVLDAAGKHLYVRSYPNALDTIFSNLLLNAIRHTPRGGVIRTTVTEQADHVAITIVDSGSGIDPHVLASLFERGPRGASVAQTSLGFGIGLSLVKQTVLALGGSIGARNEEDGGACFTVTLPRADSSLPVASYRHAPLAIAADHPAHVPAVSAPVVAGASRRGSILVIEDHDELRSHIAALFSANYRVREAATVTAGLASAKTHLPDVVICDVMLPDGHGFDLVATLKADPITDHISVILLTALADEASRLRGLTGQADLYITKPFLREELELQVANLMNQRRRLRRVAARDVWVANTTSGDGKSLAKKDGFETRLLAALETLYADTDCGVDAIAGKLAMSRKQLERKTRYCFKCSPKVLLNRYRLDKAAGLLKAGVRVVDVAQRCGFTSQSHFGALFKKRFGHAPSKQQAQQDGSVTASR